MQSLPLRLSIMCMDFLSWIMSLEHLHSFTAHAAPSMGGPGPAPSGFHSAGEDPHAFTGELTATKLREKSQSHT